MAKFEAVPPFPSLMTAAQAGHIPLDGIDPSTKGDVLNPGDSITALVTHHEKKGRRSQWLIYLQVVPPDSVEIPTNTPKPAVIYTSFGSKLEFTSSSVIVTVRTLGPFIESDAHRKPPVAQDKTARFTLDKGFLSLGLDDAAAALYRLESSKGDKGSGALIIGSKPFSADTIKEGRGLANRFHITTNEERAITGAVPALLSYMNIVRQTPSLSSILFKVVKLPSVWSILQNGGMKDFNLFDPQSDKIAPMDAAILGMSSGLPLFRLPGRVEINHHSALELTLIVTAPRRPFLACGGIVGFLAENPVDKNNYMTLRVISARRATETKTPDPAESAPVVTEAKPPWGRIVMLGASVTAGFTLSEPFGGEKTARYDLSRYINAALEMPHEPVRNFGNANFFMQPESAGKLQIDEALKARPTLVTAIDFLFWFCYGDCKDEERLQRFERGLKLLETIPCPLVLGDIPDASDAAGILRNEQIPSAQVRAAANRRLKEWAASRPHVVVLPLSGFMQAASSNAAFAVHGYSLAKGKTSALLQEDKLHPSARGCSVLALAILGACQSTEIDAPTNEVCLDPEEILRNVLKTRK